MRDRRARVSGDEYVAPDVRNVGPSITIQSPEDEDAIRRVYRVWQGRCPVYLALTNALSVATTLLWLPGNPAVCYRLRRSRVHLGHVG